MIYSFYVRLIYHKFVRIECPFRFSIQIRVYITEDGGGVRIINIQYKIIIYVSNNSFNALNDTSVCSLDTLKFFGATSFFNSWRQAFEMKSYFYVLITSQVFTLIRFL